VFKRILVATDFSEFAEAALGVGSQLARRLGAELVLLHAFVEMRPYSTAETASVQRVYEEQRLWVQKALDQRVADASATGLAVRPLLRTGPAADVIADTARAEQADLIVVGTHGLTGLNRLLLGSVAERVARLAPCSVLTVKAPEAA
jgi:nucleotide-binding universal stress UspA family protein